MTPDEPTLPLPAADPPAADPPAESPVDVPTEPLDPVVAPHVPVAQVSTAQVPTYLPPERPRGSGAKWLALVGFGSVAAAVIAVLALGIVQQDTAPAPVGTSAPPVAPTPAEPAETVLDQPAPAPADPAPAEPEPAPTPEPTTPPEPSPEPTP